MIPEIFSRVKHKEKAHDPVWSCAHFLPDFITIGQIPFLRITAQYFLSNGARNGAIAGHNGEPSGLFFLRLTK